MEYSIDLTYEAGDELLNEKARKYRDDYPDISLEEIRNKAFEKLQSLYNKQLREVYVDFIRKMDALRRNPTHLKIMRTVKRLRDEDEFSRNETIQYAVKKRKFTLERVMEEYPLLELDESNSAMDSTSSDEEERHSEY